MFPTRCIDCIKNPSFSQICLNSTPRFWLGRGKSWFCIFFTQRKINFYFKKFPISRFRNPLYLLWSLCQLRSYMYIPIYFPLPQRASSSSLQHLRAFEPIFGSWWAHSWGTTFCAWLSNQGLTFNRQNTAAEETRRRPPARRRFPFFNFFTLFITK